VLFYITSDLTPQTLPLIKLDKVSKTYKVGTEEIEALRFIDLEIEKGEFVVIVGPSGSGKSTLLHLIGGLDKPTSGEILVEGITLNKMKDRPLSKYRNGKIGFIFQDFHLQNYLNLVENVEIPLMFSHSKIRKESTMQKKAKNILDSIGLKERLNHHPNQISGGQKQRVAIARALINDPKIILADEPTGNLDSITGNKIIKLLKRIHKEKGVTVVVVTHDREIAKHADRIIEIKDGQILGQNNFEKFTSYSLNRK
jgi:putative ABC transport system ATP-binding protein